MDSILPRPFVTWSTTAVNTATSLFETKGVMSFDSLIGSGAYLLTSDINTDPLSTTIVSTAKTVIIPIPKSKNAFDTVVSIRIHLKCESMKYYAIIK